MVPAGVGRDGPPRVAGERIVPERWRRRQVTAAITAAGHQPPPTPTTRFKWKKAAVAAGQPPKGAEAEHVSQPVGDGSQQLAEEEKRQTSSSKVSINTAAPSTEQSSSSTTGSSAPVLYPSATYRCRIVVHQQSFSEREVIFNPKAFPQLRVGDIVQINKAAKAQQHHAANLAPQPAANKNDKRPSLHISAQLSATKQAAFSSSASSSSASSSSALPAAAPAPVPSTSSMDASSSSSLSPLVVRVTQLESVKGNIDCSILASLASLFDLTAREDVLLKVVSAESVRLDHLELSFDHAYIGRSDHWRIRAALQQQTVYVNKTVNVEGMKLRIDEMNRNSSGDTLQQKHTQNLTSPTDRAAGNHSQHTMSPSLSSLPASSGVIVLPSLAPHPVRVSSGLVSADTKFTFRSRSARLLFLIQLSEEMWEYADDGEVYFEKVIGFLRLLLAQWKQTHVSHSLSIILFSRTHAQPHKQKAEHEAAEVKEEEEEWEDEEELDESTDEDDEQKEEDEDESEVDKEPFQTPLCAAPPLLYSMDSVGRLYVDHYEAVVDGDAPADDDNGQWGDRLLVSLKQSFHRYQHQMRWDRRTTITPEQIIRPPGMQQLPKHYQQPFTATLVASTAVDGNVLEAINCCVSIFDKHYVDRDLYRTGQNIVLFSAGHGLFLVSPSLAQLTKQRMVDGGIGCDLICMTRPPLHAVPLFIYRTELLLDPFSFIYNRHHSADQQQYEQAEHNQRTQQPKQPLFQRSTSLVQLSSSTASNELAPLLPTSTTHPAGLASMAGTSNSGDWYIPHWISIFFYDHQDENDTPFGTKKTKVQPTAARAGQSSTDSVTEEMDDDNDENDMRDVRDERERPRHTEAGDGTEGDESDGRRLHLSSLTTASSSALQPFVPLSSCRLYDFRPTDPAYLQHWLFDSSEVDGVNSRSARLPPAAYFAKYSPYEQSRSSEQLSRHPTTVEECRVADEAVFRFRKTIIQARQDLTEKSVQLMRPQPHNPQQERLQAHHSPSSSSTLSSEPSDTVKLLPSSVNMRRAFTSASLTTNSKAFAAHSSAVNPLFSSSSPQFTWSLTFARRWAHLYSVREVEHIARFQPSWKSLCKPALLPLTVDYLQSTDELRQHYFEYNYTLTLPGDSSIESLMEEIICQRQAQNYQNVTGSSHSHAHGHSATTASTSLATLSPHSPSSASSPSSPATAPPPPVAKPRVNLAEAAAKRRAAHASARGVPSLTIQSTTSKVQLISTNEPSSSPSAASASTQLPSKSRSPLQTRKDSFRFPPPTLSSSPSLGFLPSPMSPPLTHPSPSPPPGSPNSSPSSSSAHNSHFSASSHAPLVYYFSLRNQIHCLSYDPSTRTISVRRHVHKRVLINAVQLISVPYHYYLFSPLTGGFLACDRDIEPNRDDLDWNYADQLLAQQAEQYDDTLKYRKVRFAFLPPSKGQIGNGKDRASVCKERIAAMVQLWQTLLKKTPEELQIQVAKPVLRKKSKRAVTCTTPQQLQAPAVAEEEEEEREEEEDDEEEGEEGEGDEEAHHSTDDEVSWTDTEAAPTPPSAQHLLPTATPPDEKLIAVTVEQATEEEEEESWEIDEHQHGMYNANDAPPPAALSNSSRHALSSPSSAEVDRVLNDDVGFAVRVVPQNVMKVHLPPSTTPSSRPPVNSLLPATLPRDEWFFLEYEGFYHPLCCYHWEVHWLTASGMHIEGWCRQMQKRAERLGIALVKIPAAQNIRTADAFHQPIRISLRNTATVSAGAHSSSAAPAGRDSLLTSPKLLIPIVQQFLEREVSCAHSSQTNRLITYSNTTVHVTHSTVARLLLLCCTVSVISFWMASMRGQHSPPLQCALLLLPLNFA